MTFSFWSGLIRLVTYRYQAAGGKFVIGGPAEAANMLTVAIGPTKGRCNRVG